MIPYFNLAFHAFMIEQDARHQRFASSFEDIGDAENGPKLSGCQAYDWYLLDGIEYVVDEDGIVDRCEEGYIEPDAAGMPRGYA